MSRPERLASAGILAGAGIVGVVGVLLHHTSRPATEISNYVDDILVAVHGIEHNVAGAAELTATRDHAEALRARAGGGTA